MRLKRFGYSETEVKSGDWRLEPFDLDQINLLVGKNSVGKSRTLNTIAGLARFIAAGEATMGGSFHSEFEHHDEHWVYTLRIEGATVVDEVLIRGTKVLIDRKSGFIWSEDEQKKTRFKMRDNQIAINAKLDMIQAPYLQPFNNWANSVYHFHFGSTLGQRTLHVPVIGSTNSEINLKDEDQTGQIYRHAFEKYQDAFDQAVLSDMRDIGYDVTEVGIGEMTSVRTVGNMGQLHGMFVTEKGIAQRVDQHSMSTGMFRALAIIIHVELGIFSDHAELILLDDIGEGLDFERSTALIKLLTSKIKETDTQLIMTSNDRFIMNAVDIDHWTVLNRSNSSVRAINKHNNPEAFEEFKYTGLQNFDFFSMDLATDDKGRNIH